MLSSSDPQYISAGCCLVCHAQPFRCNDWAGHNTPLASAALGMMSSNCMHFELHFASCCDATCSMYSADACLWYAQVWLQSKVGNHPWLQQLQQAYGMPPEEGANAQQRSISQQVTSQPSARSGDLEQDWKVDISALTTMRGHTPSHLLCSNSASHQVCLP